MERRRIAMRVLCNFLAGILMLIAIGGIGLGVWSVVEGAGGRQAEGLIAGVLAAMVPFAVGTIALAGATISLFCEQIIREISVGNTIALEQVKLGPAKDAKLTGSWH